jgi:hypothetical protein
MKHIMKKAFIPGLIFLVSVNCFAQVPEAISYQSIVRDLSGNPLTEHNVSLRISILAGSTNGDVVYSETHDITTNSFGLINIKIGMGTPLTGSFNSIEWWNNEYFSKIEIDIAGGSSYVETGISQLLSVPYALHAKTAGSLTGQGEDGSLKIGVNISLVSCEVNQDGAIDLTVSGGVPPYRFKWYSLL